MKKKQWLEKFISWETHVFFGFNFANFDFAKVFVQIDSKLEGVLYIFNYS